MKKNKGFTLIELLAVIVILAIIALIATPIVLNIIKDSIESATLQSAQFYIDAVEHSITKKMMDDPIFKPSRCDVQSDGNLKCNGIDIKVEVKGEVPTSGTVDFEKGKIKDVSLIVKDKTIVKQNNKLVYLKSGLYDEEGNLVASWDELLDYGINLEKDYVNENFEPLVEESEFPGVILSTNDNLKQGTKLVIDSSIKKIGSYALSATTTLKEIIIPNNVISIGNMAFAHCTSLEKIIIPDSVASIGIGVFIYCTSLGEITIPNSVTSIGIQAFAMCTSLKKIKIPNKVTSIGYAEFVGCTNLKEITIPESVTSIEEAAFEDCTSLKTINYVGTQEKWNTISFYTDWNKNTPIDMVINYNYVIPQN